MVPNSTGPAFQPTFSKWATKCRLLSRPSGGGGGRVQLACYAVLFCVRDLLSGRTQALLPKGQNRQTIIPTWCWSFFRGARSAHLGRRCSQRGPKFCFLPSGSSPPVPGFRFGPIWGGLCQTEHQIRGAIRLKLGGVRPKFGTDRPNSGCARPMFWQFRRP